jgi:hypothetical protein
MITSNIIFGLTDPEISIKGAIDAAIADIRSNTWLLDYVFSYYVNDDLTKNIYGEKARSEAKRWVLSNEIFTSMAYRVDLPKFPMVSIIQKSSTEAESTLGDVNYDTVDNIDDPTSLQVNPTIILGPFNTQEYNYDSPSGVITLPPSFNTDSVYAGMILYDVINNNQFPILSVLGPNQFSIAINSSVNLLGAYVGSAGGQTVTVEGMYMRDTYEIYLYVQDSPEELQYLSSLMMFIFLRYKQAFLEGRGFDRSVVSMGPIAIESRVGIQEKIFYRIITLNGYSRTTWPKFIGPTLQGISSTLLISDSQGVSSAILMSGTQATPAAFQNQVSQQGWELESDALSNNQNMPSEASEAFASIFTGISISTPDNTPNANGLLLTGQLLQLEYADGTHPGALSAGTQTIGGNKTFTGAITASNFSGSSSGTNSGDVTISAPDNTPNANGLLLTGQLLQLEYADGTHPGAVSTGTQIFGGNKTFTGTIGASNFSGSSSGSNTGDVTLTAFGAADNANGASLVGQALTLQPASGTNPGGVSTTTQTFAGNKIFNGNVGLGVSPGQKLHISNGNMLLEGGGETAVQFKRDAVVGTQSNPIFAFGRIVSGGINLPDWRVLYSDDTTSERPIWSQESCGTVAIISDNQRRSFFEGYEFNGQVDPDFRVNAFTGVTGAGAQIELGRGGASSSIGNMTRTGGNTVTVVTTANHSFVTGDTVDLGYVGSADANFAIGSFAITKDSNTQFHYTQAGSNVSSAVAAYFSVATDVKLRASALGTAAIVVGVFGSETTALTASAATVAVTGTISASNFSGSSSGSNTGDITISTPDSTPNANGLLLTGQLLQLEYADGTHPGAVSTSAQTFGGNKTFNGSVAVGAGLANDLTIAGSTSTNPITLTTTGSDANINIRLAPKGSGFVELLAGAAGIALNSPAQLYLNGTAGVQGILYGNVGGNSAVHYYAASGDAGHIFRISGLNNLFAISPSTTGNPVTIGVPGTGNVDANVSLNLTTKGSGSFVFQPGGSTKLTIDSSGNTTASGSYASSSTTLPQFQTTGASDMGFQSAIASASATAGAFQFNTSNTLAGASDLIAAFKNNGTNEVTIDKSGNISALGLTVSQASNTVALSVPTNGRVDLTGTALGAAGSSYLYSDGSNVLVQTGAFIPATANTISLGGTNNRWTNVIAHGIFQTDGTTLPQFATTGASATGFQTSVASGSASAGAFQFNTVNSLVGGSDVLFMVNNNGTGKLILNAAGDLSITAGQHVQFDTSGNVHIHENVSEMILVSNPASGASSAGAFQFNAATTLSGASDLLAVFQNNATTKVSIGFDGTITSNQASGSNAIVLTAGSKISFNGGGNNFLQDYAVSTGNLLCNTSLIANNNLAFGGVGTHQLYLHGFGSTSKLACDGFVVTLQANQATGQGSAAAFVFNNANTLSGAGDLLAAFQNNGTTEVSIGFDGSVIIPAAAKFFMGTGATTDPNINGLSGNLNFVNQNHTVFQNQQSTGQMFFSGYTSGTPASAVHQFANSVALTSGNIATFFKDSFITAVASIDFAGNHSGNGFTATGATSTHYSFSTPTGTTISLTGQTIGTARAGAVGDIYADTQSVHIVSSVSASQGLILNGGSYIATQTTLPQFQTTGASDLGMQSAVASASASAGAFQFNTSNTLAGASDLLAVFYNNGTNEFQIDKNGGVKIAAGDLEFTGSGHFIYGQAAHVSFLNFVNTNQVILNSRIASGSSSAGAIQIGNAVAIAGATDVLIQFYNGNGVNSLKLDPKGRATLQGWVPFSVGTMTTITTTDTAFTNDCLPSPTLLAGTPTADTTDTTVLSMIKFTTGASTNNASGVSGPFTTVTATTGPVFYAVVRTDPSAVTSVRYYVGVGASSLDQVSTLAGANTIVGAWFRFDTGIGDANWMCEVSDGAAAAATSSGIAVASATTYILAIDMTASGTAIFYINGAQVLKTTTHVNTSSTAMGIEASVTTLTTAARALSVQKVVLQQA